MKRSDIAAIILIASISILGAYFIAGAIIGKPSDKGEKVLTAAPISADIQTPDSAVFNKDAINPTVEVVIGDGQSQ